MTNRETNKLASFREDRTWKLCQPSATSAMARGKFAQRRMKGTTMTVAVANKGRKGEEGTPLSPVHSPDGRREGRERSFENETRKRHRRRRSPQLGSAGVSRGRNGISELRTCATAQIRFSSLPRPSLLTSECVCVFGGSIQFQRKPKSSGVLYKPCPRPHAPYSAHQRWPSFHSWVRPLRPPANPTRCP